MNPSVSRSSLGRALAVTALTLAATSAAARAAHAQVAGSRLNFSGTSDVVDVGADGLVLTFDQSSIASGDDNTGSFAPLNAAPGGVAGAIKPLTVGAGPQETPAFLVLGGYTFNLRYLPSGTLGQSECYVEAADGQHCSPVQTPGTTISPINLVNGATGDADAPFYSSAWFHLVGTVTGPEGGVAHEFFGTIMTDFPVSYQDALAGVEAYGFAGLPFRATFVTGAEVTVTPEPSTYALTAAGLLGVVGAARRRRTRVRVQVRVRAD